MQTDTHGTPQPDRVFVQLSKGTILDIRDVKRTGDGICGRVANGDYPIELVDGVMFIPNTRHAPAEGVRIIYEGAPPLEGNRANFYSKSLRWIVANEDKWIQA